MKLTIHYVIFGCIPAYFSALFGNINIVDEPRPGAMNWRLHHPIAFSSVGSTARTLDWPHFFIKLRFQPCHLF